MGQKDFGRGARAIYLVGLKIGGCPVEQLKNGPQLVAVVPLILHVVMPGPGKRLPALR